MQRSTGTVLVDCFQLVSLMLLLPIEASTENFVCVQAMHVLVYHMCEH